MRRITVREMNEQYGGKLPPDAVLRSENDELAAPAPAPAMKTAPTVKPTKAKRRSNRSGRFAVLNAFVDFGIAAGELTPAESLVWFVLFRDTKSEGTARTGQADIARRTGLDVRTVRRAIAGLESQGFVDIVRRGRLNAGPSTYRLHPTGKP